MINAVDFGHGDEVYVGLHGWGGSLETFRPLAPFVPDRARLRALDLPGYGASPRLEPLTADAMGVAVAAAIDGLDAPAVTLVGNCSGAIVALLAGPRLRTAVRRYVLIDPFAFVPWYFKAFVHPAYGRVAYMSTFANPLGRWLTNASLRARRTEASHLTRSFTTVDHEASLAFLHMLDGIDGIAGFAGVRQPIDIAYGERTFAAVRTSVQAWQRLWPQARAVELTGAGHLPVEEATGPLARLIFDQDTHADDRRD
jgi:pimeloyl-ACP methyl ester carboxylesterase